jgi:glyoxylase-like metal-dependent hydrolase (beta-lactamase superfamily II)
VCIVSATVRVSVLDTGYCTVPSSLVARGTGWQKVRCHAVAFLLEHSVRGPMLFDTGYAPRVLDAFAHWPDRLYKYATPTTLADPVVAQLPRFGFTARDIGAVIVSHLHADHVAGLRDFSQATFTLTQDAFALQQSVSGVPAVRRGVLQSLFPADFAERAQIVAQFSHEAVRAFGPTHDLCGDGSVRLMPLPGHARGQIGALVRTADGDVLLCADGAWTSQAYREQRPPHWLSYAIQDHMTEHFATLRALHEFSQAHPDVPILPTHCPETLRWGVGP